jgi:hypothetical protein
MKTKEYCILQTESATEMEEKVKEKLNDGYMFCGNLIAVPSLSIDYNYTILIQPMIKNY